MDVIQRLNHDLAYNVWANWQALQSLQAARIVPERAAAVMAHIIGAEWLWLRRVGRSAPAMDVWPVLSLADCETQLRALSKGWQTLASSLTLVSLASEIRYTNSKGDNWTNTLADVLTHVVLHSSYHRGQVATLLGRAGEQAAYSDYIECVHRGYLSQGWPM